MLVFSFPAVVFAQTIAFPGAEGAGRFAWGGRGGRVIEVTNLNDNGPGSLRAAVQTSGARTVVFRVSGTIKLLSRLEIKKDSITIAGQSAPGDGICIRDYTFRVAANDVIIRYMRIRMGDSTRYADDSFDGYGAPVKRRIIADHCSVSWAIDEDASFYDIGDFTMQWCYITESLYHSYHPKGNHGYGGIWGGWHASFHHNLLAHHSSRTPRFNGSRYLGQPDSELVDFRNNVIYNWGFNSAYGGEAGHQNMVANYFKYGPATNASVRHRIVQPYDSSSEGFPGRGFGKWYVADNEVYGDSLTTADNWTYGVDVPVQAEKDTIRSLQPFPFAPIAQETPEEAYNSVLLFGGASFHRDTSDARIAEEVRTGTATYGGGYKGPHTGIIDTQDSVGGWPVLNSLPAPPDSDHDGMPDQWEIDHSLNPYDATDGRIITGDGYSNLEHYLNSLVVPFPTSVKSPASVPTGFSLLPNYPNPFNPTTTVSFVICNSSFVTLRVYDVLGREVATLVNEVKQPGEYTVMWDATKMPRQNAGGLASGVYFYRLFARPISGGQAGLFTETKKLVLLK